MERTIHHLTQGTDAWHQFRLEHHGASEAAAMLGISKHTTRSELLRIKHTGIAKEFSDFVQTRILDHGHDVEDATRTIVAGQLGDELYPVTYSYGKLSASCDGITVGGDTAFECKQWARELAAAVGRKELPDEHQPQCQQVLMVTGAERLIFAVSDGTPDNFVSMTVYPDEVWQNRILAGWKQFDEDLATYTPPEVIPAAVAAPTLALPAVSIQVSGAVALTSNLGLFLTELQGFIKRLPEKPSTDQEFADCKAACKTLQEAQDALDAAEANALGQVVSFDEMKRAKALCFDLARNTRLALEKLVVAREKAIKEDIVAMGRQALADHVARLNSRLGKNYMPLVPADFAGAVKSKRTITSLKDAVDTEIARAKIAANEIADGIDCNLKVLRELAKDHAFLFADTGLIVLKPNDDFTVLVKSRIAEHKAAEAKREEAQRERIRAEEQAKAQREAEAKIRVEHEAQQKAAAAQAGVTSDAAIVSPAPAAAPQTNTPQGAARSCESINGAASLATAIAAPAPTSLAAGVGKLITLIGETISDMSAGELQQVLDAAREVKAARRERAMA